MHQKRSFLAISGGRFIFEFFPPEFLEKYFQPKRSPNSPAPVKKSKKSRPRETPLSSLGVTTLVASKYFGKSSFTRYIPHFIQRALFIKGSDLGSVNQFRYLSNQQKLLKMSPAPVIGAILYVMYETIFGSWLENTREMALIKTYNDNLKAKEKLLLASTANSAYNRIRNESYKQMDQISDSNK